MFSFAKVAVFAAIATLAVASPVPGNSGSCNTGPVQCCNSVTSASDPATAGLLGLLGVVVQDVTASIGLQCSPITALGLGGGASCSQAPVCCENNAAGGLVNIGCVPITL
ncbi:hydrophobin [Heliocybe sulcata]|uniref:Hydrophobin n=1 Tax=Heliocybe sulcata TaxID=5364 RepID=A0A5C3N1V1_9AGAM|nr:hydrophobin [Heliocybe sulcata]